MESIGKGAVAEFMGTFALVFFGAGAIIATQNADVLAIALAHGLAIAIAITMFAHISGGVFNPAIQVALLVTGKMPGTRSAVYIVAQLAGAVAASLLLSVFWPEPMYDTVGGGIPAISPDIAQGTAVLIEALSTFFLVLAVFATVVDGRNSFARLASIAIGLTITIDILATGSLTGAAMNPARWFGPALVGGDWTSWWVWIVGPVAGGVIAGVGYWWLLLKDSEPATP